MTTTTQSYSSFLTLPFATQAGLVIEWMADIGHPVVNPDKFKLDIGADRGRAMQRARTTGTATRESSSLPSAIVNDYPRFRGYVVMERAYLAHLKSIDAVRTVNAMD